LLGSKKRFDIKRRKPSGLQACLPAGRYKKQKTLSVRIGFLKKGSDILSHLGIKDETVPSAQPRLTSLFEQSLLNFL
jgi:hypothetical protein